MKTSIIHTYVILQIVKNMNLFNFLYVCMYNNMRGISKSHSTTHYIHAIECFCFAFENVYTGVSHNNQYLRVDIYISQKSPTYLYLGVVSNLND